MKASRIMLLAVLICGLMGMASAQETVVELEDFRSGGVQLNDGIGVVLESSASTGGASIE